MDQRKTPLFDALVNHKKLNAFSYHVPGHKGGVVFGEKGEDIYKSLLSIDATELAGLDDLHEPEGPILQAQELLADLYKAQESHFLVNGSTVGNLAMILSVCKDGDQVLVQRNCHKSILNGLILANVKPVFLNPLVDKGWGIAVGLDSELVEQALMLYPNIKAVILTHPNYYGMATDLTDIIKAAHQRKIPVLVDEAHGAHWVIGAPFPKSSLESGADIVVHSAHKTLPAMTMGSYLHINSSLVSSEMVKFYLQMLQSSSPSYPIMASLDLARAYLDSFTEADKNILAERIGFFINGLSNIQGITVMKQEPAMLDLLKVTIRAEGSTGYQLQKLLEKHGILTELADTKNVLLILPLLKSSNVYPFAETVKTVRQAIEDIPFPINRPELNWEDDPVNSISTLEYDYSEMKGKETKFVTISKGIGLVAAETIIPYPPGIPLIMAGEEITDKKSHLLRELLEKGSRFHGGQSLKTGHIKVY
jgi:arginine/lysine/ornithine decarboxylase